MLIGFFSLCFYSCVLYRFEPIISNVLKDFSVTFCGDAIKTKVEIGKLESRDFEFSIKGFQNVSKLRDLSSSKIGFFFLYFFCERLI